MDLYTLNEFFMSEDTVDEFVSAIWTERYSSAGDVQLVVPASLANVAKLREGTFLALRGSKEVMQIHTQEIKDNLITAIGTSLVELLNQRFAWLFNPASSAVDERIADYVETTTPGEIIANVVDKVAINPVDFAGAWAPANLDWVNEVIPFLELGAVDSSGVDERMQVPTGPLYDAISQVAAQKGVGISLYLDSADPTLGYVLKFTTYRGVSRTSDQEINPLVRLSPDLDSMSDVKEINSIRIHKNVVYVYYQGEISKHLAEPDLPEPEGFARRVLVVNAEGSPVGNKVTMPGSKTSGTYTYTYVGPTEIAAFRAQNAKDALANANYIHAIDGQTSPISEFKYGTDYGLGDIIELEGLTGTLSKARVTEYIRSQDKFGEKEYPTISVVS